MLSAVLINPHRIFGGRDVQSLQSGLSRYEHLVNQYLTARRELPANRDFRGSSQNPKKDEA